MPKESVIEIEGKIKEVLSGGRYSVLLDQGHELEAKVSGRMRMHNIAISVGDSVKIEVSPYDLTKGRIVYRNKQESQ